MAPQILASSKVRVAVSKSRKIANEARITTEAKRQTSWPKGGKRIALKCLRRFSSTARFLHQAVGRLSLRAFLLRQAAAKLEKRKRRGRKSHRSVNRDMYKVLNLVHPELEFSISSPATLENIALEAARVGRYSKRPTIESGEIETTLRLLMTGELTKFAVWEGTKERHSV